MKTSSVWDINEIPKDFDALTVKNPKVNFPRDKPTLHTASNTVAIDLWPAASAAGHHILMLFLEATNQDDDVSLSPSPAGSCSKIASRNIGAAAAADNERLGSILSEDQLLRADATN